MLRDPDVVSTKERQAAKIRIERLDEILPPDSKIDFMKVDVEGWEPDVFEGAWAVIDRSPEVKMVVELSP